jgi:hypothetical protein
MPRMQIYLPDDLYAEVKRRKLRASELAQQALRAEIRRQELGDAADEYLRELMAEVGEPTPEELAWAEDFVAQIKAHEAKSDEAKSDEAKSDEPETPAGDSGKQAS